MNSHATKLRSRSANIFISYRREDGAGHAGRLFDHLSRHFPGRLFMDVDTLEPGVDFVDAIAAAVGSCEVLIVVIGREWLTLRDAAGHRRLDDPADFVRLEVESALARKIRVIPVLVEDAPRPRVDDLPASLAALVRRNAIELSDSRWTYDVDRLAQTIQQVLEDTDASRPATAAVRPVVPASAGISARLRTLLYLLAVGVLVSAVVPVPAERVQQTPSLDPQPAKVQPQSLDSNATGQDAKDPALEAPKASPTREGPKARGSPIVKRKVEPERPRPPVSVEVHDEPPEAPASDPWATTITSPRNGAKVGRSIVVEGTLSGLGAGQRAFLCLQEVGGGLIFPRDEIFPNGEGLFQQKVGKGVKGRNFDLLVVVAANPEAAAALGDRVNWDKGLRGLPQGSVVTGSVVSLRRQGWIGVLTGGG